MEVYTDGACSGNQFDTNIGAWALIAVASGSIVYRKSNYELNTTNNRMELKAVIEAVKYLKNTMYRIKTTIFSDSQYVVDTINKGWKRNKNHDLWNELDGLLYDYDFITIQKVKGHANNYYNNLVDKLAVDEISKYKGVKN